MRSRMMLAAIMPAPEGFELRTFECRKCDHTFTNAVAKDPMNAVSARWDCRRVEAADLDALTGDALCKPSVEQ
jgi:hypothetical protein